MKNFRFARDPRRQQEIRLRPAADALYFTLWKPRAIKRLSEGAGDNHPLDQHFGIDALLTLRNGARITVQEKFLSAKYASFETLTVENYQNPRTKERGDWFKHCPQVVLCAYEAETHRGFQSWIVVNWLALVMYPGLEWRFNKNKDGRARASFRFVRFDDIPIHAVIARSV